MIVVLAFSAAATLVAQALSRSPATTGTDNVMGLPVSAASVTMTVMVPATVTAPTAVATAVMGAVVTFLIV